MQDLVQAQNGKMFTTSKILADELSDNKNTHTRVIQIIEKIVTDIELFSRCTLGDTVSYQDDEGANIVFTESTHKTKAGNTYFEFIMNEEAYSLLISNLQKYKKARKIQILFIKAFNLMRRRITNNQSTINHVIKHGILPTDDKGTISEVNGKERDKIVKSYYRSTNGKEDLVLDEEIEMCKPKTLAMLKKLAVENTPKLF